jgi:hypothetical protein
MDGHWHSWQLSQDSTKFSSHFQRQNSANAMPCAVVAGNRMRVHRGARRFKRRGSLCHEACDRSRQHIPHAWHGHAGVAAITQPWHFTGVPYQRASAFEHDGAATPLAQRSQRGNPILLHFPGTDSKQARCLAGMRRQHPVHAMLQAVSFGNQIQGICVDNQPLPGRVRDKRSFKNFARPAAATQTRADDEDIRVACHSCCIRGAMQRAEHQLGSCAEHAQMFRQAGNGYEAGADTQRSFSCQTHGAWHASATTNDDDATELALVALALPGTQDIVQYPLRQPAQYGLKRGFHAQCIKMQLA